MFVYGAVFMCLSVYVSAKDLATNFTRILSQCCLSHSLQHLFSCSDRTVCILRNSQKYCLLEWLMDTQQMLL